MLPIPLRWRVQRSLASSTVEGLVSEVPKPKRYLDALRKTAGHGLGIVLSECANTASASSIIAFHNHHADLQRGALGVVCRFCADCSLRSVVLRRL